MKAFPASLQAHLDSGTTTLAWCWRITRADGQIFGFTDHDQPLNFLGTTFLPDSGLIASEIRAGSDLAVDAQDAIGALTSATITETDIIDGLWDSAAVEIWQANWADTASRVLLRRGSIGQVRRGRVHFVAEMRSLSHVLGQTVGRVYQSNCDETLGSSKCGVALAGLAFTGSGAIVALSSARKFIASGLASYADGHFSLGIAKFTSGANAGHSIEVLTHSASGGVVEIDLLEIPVQALGVGDAFLITAGCDKTYETCCSKFNNTVNFRGFPNIPGQDVVAKYAEKGSANSGAVLRPTDKCSAPVAPPPGGGGGVV